MAAGIVLEPAAAALVRRYLSIAHGEIIVRLQRYAREADRTDLHWLDAFWGRHPQDAGPMVLPAKDLRRALHLIEQTEAAAYADPEQRAADCRRLGALVETSERA